MLSKEHIIQATNDAIEGVNLFTFAFYWQNMWATEEQAKMIGDDAWDVETYPKATISSLVTEGNLELYRAMPGELKNFFVNLYDSVNEYGH